MSFLTVVYLAGFVLFCLLAEITGKCVARALRRFHIYRRRHCLPRHTWGERFGPFRPGRHHNWYWGWKCIHCAATKTEMMSCSEAEAAFIQQHKALAALPHNGSLTLNDVRNMADGKVTV